MNFISLVGTQPVAVLNPLLSLIERGQKPEQIALLATKKSKPFADRMKELLCHPDMFRDNDIKIIAISSTLEVDAEGRQPAHIAIQEHLKHATKPVFNLAGGMNFQVTACLSTIDIGKAKFIYPEASKVIEVELKDNKINSAEYKLPGIVFKIVDILKIQGVTFKQKTFARHPFLIKTLKLSGIHQLPKEMIDHIKICPSAPCSRGVFFDCVVNVGNQLNFIKVILSKDRNDEESRKAVLREIRQIISVAGSRKEFGELFHRNILVLTNNKLVAERIEKEAREKIGALYIARPPAATKVKSCCLHTPYGFILWGRNPQPHTRRTTATGMEATWIFSSTCIKSQYET